VGVIPDIDFDIGQVYLEAGDILIAYTDGVTEARNLDGKFFTEKQLLTLLEQSAPSAVALLDRLEGSVRAHIGDAVQFDDITMLAIRRVSIAERGAGYGGQGVLANHPKRGEQRDIQQGDRSNSHQAAVKRVILEADNIPPETSIDSAVDGNGTSLADGDSTLSESIEITFSGTDNVEVASFECSLDGEAFSTCTSPFTASGLSLSSHTFEARAVDTADNTDPTPASFTWTIVTPSEATQELIEDVEALNLERGIENSLIARLNSTIRSLENGNVRAAINSLQAFINTVEAQAGNNIPQEDADKLISSAQSIIDALSSS
jgi:hypothetical protein